ncbi:MAG: M23 family metallopeptidase [Rubrobacter sp.]|jgi:collagen type III alpha|nr:M23 family metallopeptidase [Rubrobacter sp.]
MSEYTRRAPETPNVPDDRNPPRKRKRGIGGTVFFFLVAASLVLFIAQNDGLRERVASLFEREPGEAVFPLPPEYGDSYTNDWGAPRSQGTHEGTDIYAPEGTPIYSITSGTITTAYGSNDDGWNTLGGYTVMIRADRDSGPVQRGDRLYYAHMSEPTPLEDGTRIEAGDRIGTVGRTAGEEPGTVADFPPHLHLGWYGGVGGLLGQEREYETAGSGAINPYPLLRQTIS